MTTWIKFALALLLTIVLACPSWAQTQATAPSAATTLRWSPRYGPLVLAAHTIAGAPVVRMAQARKPLVTTALTAYGSKKVKGCKFAVGDLDGDGFPELVTVPGEGIRPVIKVFDLASGRLENPDLGGAIMQSASDSGLQFVRVATGDVNGDGRDEVIVAPLAYFEPRVWIFDGTGNLVNSFLVYEDAYLYGVRIAAGDLNGDGKAEVIVAPNVRRAAEIRVFNGVTGARIDDIVTGDNAYPLGPNYTRGVEIAAGDVTGDGCADIVIASSYMDEWLVTSSTVTVFDGRLKAITNRFTPLNTPLGLQVAVGYTRSTTRMDIIVARTNYWYGRVATYDALTSQRLEVYHLGPKTSGYTPCLAGFTRQFTGVPVAAALTARAKTLSASGPMITGLQAATRLLSLNTVPSGSRIVVSGPLPPDSVIAPDAPGALPTLKTPTNPSFCYAVLIDPDPAAPAGHPLQIGWIDGTRLELMPSTLPFRIRRPAGTSFPFKGEKVDQLGEVSVLTGNGDFFPGHRTAPADFDLE